MKLRPSGYWIRSGFYSLFQRFSLTIFGLISFMIIVRLISKSQMGTWALFLIITTIFETTKSGLLKNAHIRFITGLTNDVEKTEIATSSLVINGIISLVFIFFLLIFFKQIPLWLNAEADLGLMLLWFIPGLVGMVLFSHFEAIQQSNLEFKGVFIGNFFRQLTFIVLIIIELVADKGLTLVELAFYQSISILVGCMILFINTRKYMRFVFSPSLIAIKKIVGYGKYIFTSTALANIASNIDQVMTSGFLSSSTVAYYNTASRINLVIDMPSYAAAEVLFPKTSIASSEKNSNKITFYYEKMVGLLMCITVPASIFILIFPKLPILLIAGKNYYAAAPILQLYILTGLLRPMQNQAANLLNAVGKPSLCLKINAIMLIIYLLINYLCLTYFGFYGAAIGTLITTILGSVLWYYVMKKQININFSNIFRHMKETYTAIFQMIRNFISGKANSFNKSKT